MHAMPPTEVDKSSAPKEEVALEYTLHYFPVYVRGDPISALLYHAGVPLNTHTVMPFGPEWDEFKQTVPGNQVPCLELANGQRMGQSKAIQRYLGKKYGYYPEDPMEAYYVDSLIDSYDDVIGEIYKPMFP